MPKQTLTNDDAARAAAQSLIRDGLATYAEIAQLMGISRQAVRQWGTESTRATRLARLWRDAIKGQTK